METIYWRLLKMEIESLEPNEKVKESEEETEGLEQEIYEPKLEEVRDIIGRMKKSLEYIRLQWN